MESFVTYLKHTLVYFSTIHDGWRISKLSNFMICILNLNSVLSLELLINYGFGTPQQIWKRSQKFFLGNKNLHSSSKNHLTKCQRTSIGGYGNEISKLLMSIFGFEFIYFTFLISQTQNSRLNKLLKSYYKIHSILGVVFGLWW